MNIEEEFNKAEVAERQHERINSTYMWYDVLLVVMLSASLSIDRLLVDVASTQSSTLTVFIYTIQALATSFAIRVIFRAAFIYRLLNEAPLSYKYIRELYPELSSSAARLCAARLRAWQDEAK